MARSLVFIVSLRIKSQWISGKKIKSNCFCFYVFLFFLNPDFAFSSGISPELFQSQRPLVTASSWPFPSHHSCLLKEVLCCLIWFPSLGWLKSRCPAAAGRLRGRERHPGVLKKVNACAPPLRFSP